MRRVLAVAAALVALACASPRAAHADGAVEREIVVGRTTRSYLITVPSTWDRRSPIPLILVFHGAGSDPENMVDATGFTAMAQSRPAIVVYPRGLDRRFDVDPPAGRASVDVLLFDALMARLRGRFPLDERRIFATGFSNGAAFCYRLAAERPDVIAAIAPVAGYLPSLERATPAIPIPLLHLHGTADGRVGVPTLSGRPGEPVPTWAAWNGCRAEPAISHTVGAKGLVLDRADYAGATVRSDTSLVLAKGVEHDWPGGEGGAASQLIFAFFFAHPRDPPAPPPAPVPPTPPVPRPK